MDKVFLCFPCTIFVDYMTAVLFDTSTNFGINVVVQSVVFQMQTKNHIDRKQLFLLIHRN